MPLWEVQQPRASKDTLNLRKTWGTPGHANTVQTVCMVQEKRVLSDSRALRDPPESGLVANDSSQVAVAGKSDCPVAPRHVMPRLDPPSEIKPVFFFESPAVVTHLALLAIANLL